MKNLKVLTLTLALAAWPMAAIDMPRPSCSPCDEHPPAGPPPGGPSCQLVPELCIWN